MYISKLELKNIKCFKKISIDFKKKGKPILWTMLLGNNAVGKSTLLKSIAMGLCDEASAAALMKESQGEFLRKNETDGSIEITLKKNKTGEKFKIITAITKATLDDPEKVSQSFEPKETKAPWRDIFVCGYGIHRTDAEGGNYNKYSQLNAVYSLFVNESLMDPELILRRQPKELIKSIEKTLLSILMLDKENHSIGYTQKGMTLDGPWGSMYLFELSDGYRSTSNWVMDFFGWQIFADRIITGSKLSDTSGIVLIDELENHLHPKWRRELIHILKNQLPNVQFIATTHSPVLASSVGGLTSEGNRDNLVYLDLKEDNTVELSELDSLKGLDINQVLASKAFDYIISGDPDVEKVLRVASILAGKGNKRTSPENELYQKIKKELKKILPAGQTLIEREIQEETLEETKSNIKKLEKKIFGKEND